MATPPTTRPSPAKVPATPFPVLPPRVRAWPLVLTAGVLTTVAGASWSAITGDLSVALVCWLGVVVTALCLAPTIRSDLRRSRVDKALEQLAPALGFRRLTRSKVRVHGWSGLVRGPPRTVVLHYARPVRDADPNWKAEIVATVSHVFRDDYVVRRHNDLRCRMVLRRVDTDKGETAVDPHEQAPLRVRKLVTELLGESSTITLTEFDADGEVRVIEVHEPTDTRLVSVAYRKRIERIWSTMMPGRWRARFDLEADRVRLELRPAFPTNIWLPAPTARPPQDPRAAYDTVGVPYAVDEDGRTTAWSPSVRPNLLLVGTRGTGRTSTTRAVLLQLAHQGWPCWIVDGNDGEFAGLRGWPNVQIVASGVEEQIATVHRAHEIVTTRLTLIDDDCAASSDFDPLVVALSDWAEFRDGVDDWYQRVDIVDGPARPEAIALVRDIARKGHPARVHLVIGTERPEPEQLGDTMRANFRERAALGRLTGEGSMLMWRSSSAGVSTPRNYPGRGTGVGADDSGVEIQTYQCPDPARVEDGTEPAELLQRLRPSHPRHDRLLVLPPDDGLDGSDEPVELSYARTAQALWVGAAERPDLDPLRTDGIAFRVPDDMTDLPEAEDVPLTPVDSFTGYGEPANVCITDVRPGDLVLVEEATDTWATATDPPEPDVIDSELWCLEWRSDDDEDGTIQTGEDEFVVVRRPSEVPQRAGARE
ncbi:MAG: hypothetical protein ACRDO7_02620 [Nocardioidaceae bacterium]